MKIGGIGWLGGSITKRLLKTGHVAQQDLRLFNRSGKRNGFEAWPDAVIANNDSATFVADNDVVVLAVRPEQFKDVAVDASDVLVVSVMASTVMGAAHHPHHAQSRRRTR